MSSLPRDEGGFAEAATSAPQARDASAEADAVPDQLAEATARGHDPLRPYPYVEPDYPIGPDRLGLTLTATDHVAIKQWETERDRLRAVRDAWNSRCEQLLLHASAQRVPTGKATLADALVRALTRPNEGPKTTVRLLLDPLSGWARTPHDELLPPAVLDQLVRALPTPTASRRADLCRYDQGRATRHVTPALRRLLGQLDGERCRFPGCTHTRYLHAHHLQYWRHGGTTDLANLVLLLCTKHHRLLHTLGYQLALDADRTLRVSCPDGTPLEHHPVLPDASAEALPPASRDTLETGYRGDRFDLGYAVNVMLAHAA